MCLLKEVFDLIIFEHRAFDKSRGKREIFLHIYKRRLKGKYSKQWKGHWWWLLHLIKFRCVKTNTITSPLCRWCNRFLKIQTYLFLKLLLQLRQEGYKNISTYNYVLVQKVIAPPRMKTIKLGIYKFFSVYFLPHPPCLLYINVISDAEKILKCIRWVIFYSLLNWSLDCL